MVCIKRICAFDAYNKSHCTLINLQKRAKRLILLLKKNQTDVFMTLSTSSNNSHELTRALLPGQSSSDAHSVQAGQPNFNGRTVSRLSNGLTIGSGVVLLAATVYMAATHVPIVPVVLSGVSSLAAFTVTYLNNRKPNQQPQVDLQPPSYQSHAITITDPSVVQQENVQLKADLAKVQATCEKLQAQFNSLQGELQGTQNDLRKANANVATKQLEIEELQSKIELLSAPNRPATPNRKSSQSGRSTPSSMNTSATNSPDLAAIKALIAQSKSGTVRPIPMSNLQEGTSE